MYISSNEVTNGIVQGTRTRKKCFPLSLYFTLHDKNIFSFFFRFIYMPTDDELFQKTCKSQNINSIYLNLKFTFGTIQVIINVYQVRVCFSA